MKPRTIAVLSVLPGMMVLCALPPKAPAQTPAAKLVINDVTVPFETNGGAGQATFTVSFADSTPHGQVTLFFSTTGGTATAGTSCSAAGTDYIAANSIPLSFTASQTSQSIHITVCGDTRDEPDETFFVNLFSATGATIQDGQGQATLIDDDPPPLLRISDVVLTEGPAGVTANAQLTVTLTGLTDKMVSVAYSTADVTASAGSCGTSGADYEATSGTLTFGGNQTSPSTQFLRIPVCGDDIREGNQTFRVGLSATNATIQDGTGVVTITDDEPLPTLSITAAVETREPLGTTATAAVNAVFAVTLGGPSTTQTVSVQFATTPGTARAGSTCALLSWPVRTTPGDYLTQTGTLAFAPPVRTRQITVPICRDLDSDSNETFSVSLSGAVNATIANATGIATIR